MKILDAINTVLSAIGENMVLSLESSNPTLGLVKKKIKDATTELLSNTWWFNTTKYITYPDSEGFIQVGTDVIDVMLVGNDDIVTVTKDGLLFNQTENTDRFFVPKLELYVVRDVPFDELPIPVQITVTYTAAAQVYADDFGVDAKYQQLRKQADDARAVLSKLHLSKKKYNTGQSPMFKRIARGIRL